MRLRLTLVLFAAFTLGCSLFEPTDTGFDESSADSGGESGDAGLTVHCGDIEGDETWSAGVHRVKCDVEVIRGSLTLEPGVEVYIEEGFGIAVGADDYEAVLIAEGTESDPVRFLPLVEGSEPSWDGILFGGLAGGSRLAHTEVHQGGRGSTKGALVIESELEVEYLHVDGANNDGLHFRGDGGLAGASYGLTIENAGDHPVRIDVNRAHTLPSTASSYTGNGIDAIEVAGGDVDGDATWEDLGVPYELDASTSFGGSAGEPAVWTLGAGVTVQVAKNAALNFSKDASASGLVVNGSPEAPVTLTSQGAEEAGYWSGLRIYEGAADVVIEGLIVEYAGGGSTAAAIWLKNAEVDLVDTTIRVSEGAGLGFKGSGRLGEDSSGIVIDDAGSLAYGPAGAMGTLPADTLATGLVDERIVLLDDGSIEAPATWPNLGVPYVIQVDVNIEGDAETPAVLSLAEGTELRFDNGKVLALGKNGAAGLVAVGTEEAPIVFTSQESNAAGAWDGIAVYSNTENEQLVLDHVRVENAGGGPLDGALHFNDAGGSLDHLVVNNSETWGVWIEGSESPTLGEISGEDNALGLIYVDD